MDFEQKYELIAPLPGEGPKSFRARQKGLARDVTVHFLVGGQTSANQALLTRLRALPPDSMARLIEVGNNNGVLYIVTVAPPFQHLLEWLKDQEPAPAPAPVVEAPPVAPAILPPVFVKEEPAPAPVVEAPSTTRAGAWKVPAMSPPAAAPPAASEPGEFTRLFQTVPGPAAVPASPAPPPAANIPQPSVAPAEPKPQPPATPPTPQLTQ